MFRRIRIGALMGTLVTLALLGITSRASATFTITLHSSNNTFSDKVIVDGGNGTGGAQGDIADEKSGSDIIGAGLVNSISFAGFDITFVGSQRNGTGTDAKGQIDISTLAITNVSAGSSTLTITVFADGFTKPNGGTDAMTLTDNISVTGSNSSFSVTSQSTGQGLGTDGTTGSTSELTLTELPSSAKSDGSFVVGTPVGSATYSLTKVVTLTMAEGEDTLQVTGTTTAVVPAPPAGVLALIGVVGLLGGRFLRRKSPALQMV